VIQPGGSMRDDEVIAGRRRGRAGHGLHRDAPLPRTEMLELITGGVVYLANPWLPADLLACVMKGLGGLMIIEALVVVGFSDAYFHFWLKNLANMHRGWALVTAMWGFALTVFAALRFN
jgi:hypothetical protein